MVKRKLKSDTGILRIKKSLWPGAEKQVLNVLFAKGVPSAETNQEIAEASKRKSYLGRERWQSCGLKYVTRGRVVETGGLRASRAAWVSCKPGCVVEGRLPKRMSLK